MVVDPRHTIISLVAVFLALGLGMVIGSALLSEDLLLSEQQQLVVQLEQELFRLRQDNRLLTAELARVEEEAAASARLAELLWPLGVRGLLEGRRVAILRLGTQGEPAGIAHLVAVAGGEVGPVLTLAGRPAGSQAAGRNPWSRLAGTRDPATELGKALGQALTAAQPMEALAAVGDGLGRTGEASGPVDGVVALLPAEADPVADHWPRLLAGLQSAGLRVVAVAPPEVEPSPVPDLARHNVSSVDHAHRPAGRLALVLLLAGRVDGHFGTGPGTEAILPDLEPVFGRGSDESSRQAPADPVGKGGEPWSPW